MGSNKGQIKSSCDYCGQEKERWLCDTWEMQVLHFADGEVNFLTCDKCKQLSPMKFIEKIENNHQKVSPNDLT